jgi:hypothetical protein
MEVLSQKLSQIDELETWREHVQGISKHEILQAFESAQPLWVHRMICENKLYLHPEVIAQLRRQNWMPSDLHKRMIWASIIASDESSSSKKRMYELKGRLIKKHGRDWWEDVYSRLKYVYAAKERIKKIHFRPAMSTLISNTSIGAEAASYEQMKALRMIPRI